MECTYVYTKDETLFCDGDLEISLPVSRVRMIAYLNNGKISVIQVSKYTNRSLSSTINAVSDSKKEMKTGRIDKPQELETNNNVHYNTSSRPFSNVNYVVPEVKTSKNYVAPEVKARGWITGRCIEGDCINGTGLSVYSNGEEYIGQWERGMFHGHGKLTELDGSFYEGEFYEGNPTGRGGAHWRNIPDLHPEAMLEKEVADAPTVTPPNSAVKESENWEKEMTKILFNFTVMPAR